MQTFSSSFARRPGMAAALALCTLLALQGCGKSNEAPAAPAAEAAPQDPMVVKVKPEMASNFKVEPLKKADIASVQEIPGRIEANQRLLSRIGASVTGRVTDVLVEPGDNVRAGQALARVASPELTEHSANSTVEMTMMIFRLRSLSDSQPTKIAATAQVSDSAEPSMPTCV